MKDDQQTDVRNEVMNRVIQIWKLKNMDIVDKNTIKTRIIRLLEDADKLGKFTRDMKKPEFIAKHQKKFDVVFDIAKSPVKNAAPRAGPSKESNENQEINSLRF